MTTIDDYAAFQLDSAATSQTDEQALVARLRAGDADASEELVRQHGGHLLAVARRFLRCEEDAADAVQDAFISAFRNIDRFECESRLGTWLHRIVVNASLMKLRSQKRRKAVSIDALLPQYDVTGHDTRPAVEWSALPGDAIEADELRAYVRACIDQLPDSHRVVLLLRDIEELDTSEAAARLNITEGALKVRLHRARQALRTLLDPFMRQIR